MDEPDAIIRPLPGRYDQGSAVSPGRRGKDVRGGTGLHAFHRHPPVGVKLLEALLPDRERVDESTFNGGNKGTSRSSTKRPRIQTIWTSATMNSTLRSYIVKRGWARPRGEGGVVLDYPREGQMGIDGVEHSCLVVDPRSGTTRDLTEPVPPDSKEMTASSGPNAISDPSHSNPHVHAHPAGDVHPFLIETLALLWASNPHPGKTIVIPPPGTSVPRFQAALSELECPSVSLDVDSRETAREVDEALVLAGSVGEKTDDETLRDEVKFNASEGGKQTPEGDQVNIENKVTPPEDNGTLLILPRTQLRGIDIQGIKTVYLLGGVGLKSTSKPNVNGKEPFASTSAGTWAEREREYLHWVGRMSRLSGTVDPVDSVANGQPDRMISIVMDGPEVAVMRKLLGSRGRNAEDAEQALPVDQ